MTCVGSIMAFSGNCIGRLGGIYGRAIAKFETFVSYITISVLEFISVVGQQ